MATATMGGKVKKHSQSICLGVLRGLELRCLILERVKWFERQARLVSSRFRRAVITIGETKEEVSRLWEKETKSILADLESPKKRSGKKQEQNREASKPIVEISKQITEKMQKNFANFIIERKVIAKYQEIQKNPKYFLKKGFFQRARNDPFWRIIQMAFEEESGESFWSSRNMSEAAKQLECSKVRSVIIKTSELLSLNFFKKT